MYYNVDYIHTAIYENKQIKFHYAEWTVKKKLKLKKNGAFYVISLWALTWDDENYYLVAYDASAGIIKHYRVDKMLSIKVENKVREGRCKFKEPDMVTYDKKMFNMFNGEERNVEILCENSLAGVMIDRFGKDVRITKVDNGHFRVVVKVAASMHFVHWIMALGDGVKIVAPDSLVEQIREEINRLANEYSK